MNVILSIFFALFSGLGVYIIKRLLKDHENERTSNISNSYNTYNYKPTNSHGLYNPNELHAVSENLSVGNNTGSKPTTHNINDFINDNSQSTNSRSEFETSSINKKENLPVTIHKESIDLSSFTKVWQKKSNKSDLDSVFSKKCSIENSEPIVNLPALIMNNDNKLEDLTFGRLGKVDLKFRPENTKITDLGRSGGMISDNEKLLIDLPDEKVKLGLYNPSQLPTTIYETEDEIIMRIKKQKRLF